MSNTNKSAINVRDIVEKIEKETGYGIKESGLAAIQKFIVKKENGKKGKLLVYVNFEDADEVDALIKKNKTLDKALNVKDSTGKYKVYYFNDMSEADGSYGDLGAIPTAPSDIGDPRKKKSLFIVNGEVRENGVD